MPPISYLVLVCGLPTFGIRPQTKAELESLFKTRFPESRVIAFDAISHGEAITFRPGWIRQMADDLLAQIIADEEFSKHLKSATPEEKAPIIFLSHNIGGWIVKQALVRAMNEWRYHELAMMTRAALFFGTPHRPTKRGTWENHLMRLFLASSVKIPNPSGIIRDAAEAIGNISWGFSAVRTSFYVVNYFEQQTANALYGFGDWVFDEYASTLDLPSGQNIGLPCSHPELWWFEDGDQKTDALWLLIEKLVQNTQPVDLEYKRFLRRLLQYDPGLYQIHQPLATEDSMTWIAENESYKKWLACRTSCFLNLQCEPGSGTATLSSYIMGRLRADPATEKAPLLSFSCRKQYIRSQRPETLFLSLCRQLLASRPPLYQQAAPICKWILKQSLFTSPEATWVLFRSLLSCHPSDQPIFCFITGFNDCDRFWQQTVAEIMSMSQAAKPTASSVKFVLANCVSADFRSPWEGADDDIYFALDLASQPQMKLAVKGSVRSLLRQKAHQSAMWAEHEDEIMDTLFAEGTNPSYFVAVQKLQLLEKPNFRSSDEEISSRLRFLPRSPGLHESLTLLYTKLLRHVNQWERRALDFIVASVRPLRTTELAILLALDPAKVSNLASLRKRIPCDVIRDLSCEDGIRHLITVVGDRVFPVHGTLASYLAKQEAHFACLEACLTYLRLFNQSITGRSSDNQSNDGSGGSIGGYNSLETHVSALDATGTQKNPEHRLLMYSTLYWFEHYKLCDDCDSSRKPVLDFLQDPPLLSTWFTLFRRLSKRDALELDQDCSPIAVASGLGLVNIVRQLLATDQERRQSQNDQCDTALILAARNGSVAIVDELLPCSTAVDEAFGLAAEMGNELLMNHLLTTQPSEAVASMIEKKDALGFTPLMRALRGGHFAVAEILRSKGASANVIALDKSRPLHLVTRLGHAPLIQQLLPEESAWPEIGAEDDEGYDCFKIAAESGFHDVVQLFLGKGGKDLINSPLGKSDKTPLCLAVTYGQYETAKVLLRAGANPRLHRETAFSPLYIASSAGFVRLVELLLSEATSRQAEERAEAVSSPQEDSGGTAPGQGETSAATPDGSSQPPEISSIRDASSQTTPPTSPGTSSNEDSKINSPPFPELNACLRVAAQKGHYEIVILFLNLPDGIDPDDRGSGDGETALHLAAAQGHEKIVAALLDKKFKADAEDAASMTPLQLAAQSGHLSVVEILIRCGARVNKKDPATSTDASKDDRATQEPLELAAELGHVNVATLLLKNGAQPTKTSFELAANHGHARVLGALKKAIMGRTPPGDDADEFLTAATVTAVRRGYGAAVNELVTPELAQKIRTQHQHYLVHLAAEHGHDTIIRILVDKGFSCDEMDEEENSPLHIAVKDEKLSTIDMLIKLGAGRDKYNGDKETPLYCAARDGNAAAVRRLLEKGAQMDLLCGDAAIKVTALYRACYNGHVDVVKCLLEYNADHTIRGSQGWTVLHSAFDCKAVAKVLLDKHPALLHMKNDYESTPIVIAAQEGRDDAVTLFLERGADANAQNKSGSSALHRAATQGHDSTVRLLVEPPWEANPNITKKDGATPLHMGAFHGQIKVVEYLVDKVADINVESQAYGSPLCAAVISAGNNSQWQRHSKDDKWDKVCELLLGRDADPNSFGGPYHSPLQAAAGFGYQDMVQSLLAKGANPNALGGNHGTALLAAIRGGHEGVVETLLGGGADPGMAVQGTLPLETAFRSGNAAIVDLLLQRRTDVGGEEEQKTKQAEHNVPLSDGTTAIWHAVRVGMISAVKRLVEMEVSLASGTSPGRTLLTYAMTCDEEAVTEYLMTLAKRDLEGNRKIDVDERNSAGEAPLHVAAQLGNHDWAQKLCEELQADVDIEDAAGATPLMVAIRKDHEEIQDTLLHYRADPAKRDRLGRDALYWACLCLDDDGVKKISGALRKRDDIWADCCLRALPAAIAANKIDLAQLLLREGDLDARLVDRDGWTPRYTAECYEHSEIARMLDDRPAGSDDIEPALPSAWSETDLRYPLELRDRGLTVVLAAKPSLYEEQQPRCLVRANHCLSGKGKCYFEIYINPLETAPDGEQNGEVDEESEKELILGVGFCRDEAPLDRMVGWDRGSWGYHGDDGQLFVQDGIGMTYGKKFGAGDVIGCAVDFDEGKAYFSLNGENFGVAVSGLKGKLYPAVSFDSKMPGRSVTATFEDPFRYSSPAFPEEARQSPQQVKSGSEDRRTGGRTSDETESGSDSDGPTWRW